MFDRGKTVFLGVANSVAEVEAFGAEWLANPNAEWCKITYHGPFEPGSLAFPE